MAHGLDTARVQFRLGVDLSRAALRALHVLADVGHRRLRRQWHRRRRDNALVAAVAAVHPQELVVAQQVTEGDGLHYEVLINSRFVDPLAIQVPRERSLTGR